EVVAAPLLASLPPLVRDHLALEEMAVGGERAAPHRTGDQDPPHLAGRFRHGSEAPGRPDAGAIWSRRGACGCRIVVLARRRGGSGSLSGGGKSWKNRRPSGESPVGL